MSLSASRLTLYAILASIENDLRSIILVQLSSEGTPKELLGEELSGRAHERFVKDNPSYEPHNSVLPMVDLLPYIDFGDCHGVLNRNSDKLPKTLAGSLKRWTPRLERLGPVRNRVAHGRPLQFDDFARTIETADELLSSDSVPWVELRLTTNKLKEDPSFVLGMTLPSIPANPSLRHNLPAPDFDETGFLGRSKEVSELTRHCLGPYPVVTIVGDGGLGKTALALKVAYDLLDLVPQQFDAIIWSSSKTTRLTAQEIVKIESAINTSLGLLQSLGNQLGGDESQPLEDILEYLKDFRILLILDNLETVIDDRIRTFLERLPRGSKVLITSRIGLGAFEFPYRLQPLESKEGVQLLRALATARDIGSLRKLSNPKLGHFCERMHNSPGYIKWFVAAIQAGKRPEEVLAKPALFLDFCLSNVYGYLSEDSRLLLKSMLSIPAASSQAELAYLTELETLAMQRALQQLMTTNMTVMSSVPTGSSFESRYMISDLPREYLLKHHPVSPEDYDQFKKRNDRLISQGEQIRAEASSNPFSIYSINMRSRRDLIVARHLLDAIAAAEQSDFKKADRYLETAHNLAPDYFEVYRVHAFVDFRQRNYPGARDSFEAAIDLEPNYAPLRYAFARFAMTCLDDMDLACTQLNEGLRSSPDSPEVQLELARVYLYTHQFDLAHGLLVGLKAKVGQMTRTSQRTITYDLYLQYFTRAADHSLKTKGNTPESLAFLADLIREFKSIPELSVDDLMRSHLSKAIPVAEECLDELRGGPFEKEATEIVDYLYRVTPTKQIAAGARSSHDEIKGTVQRILPYKSFGFVNTTGGVELFFHRNALRRPADWKSLNAGSKVLFRLGVNAKGPCAVDVRLDILEGAL